jgi:hypothetical protein
MAYRRFPLPRNDTRGWRKGKEIPVFAGIGSFQIITMVEVPEYEEMRN